VASSGVHFVFDITVPEYANYLANGLVHHNSGKSALQLGAYTQLQAMGKVKKGWIIAPSQVVGQFGGEALRYLQPGKFKWLADPSASREQRILAYKDPGTHFAVVTHQSFRDDMLYLGAKHAGVTPKAMADKVLAMTEEQRGAWAKNIIDKEGLDLGYMAIDESQNTLNREGKENSRLADVVDAFSRHAAYYMPASGDPVKNDASEVFDALHKMDPPRYQDRGSFMRKYGGNTTMAQGALRREMARYIYPSRIDPDVNVERKEVSVPMSGEQQAALTGLRHNLARMRVARMGGTVDVAAAKVMSPTAFVGVPPEKEQAVAAALQRSLGIVKEAAVKRIINNHPAAAKADRVVELVKERKGKPGIVFAHSLETVKNLAARLTKEGFRVVALTGADNASQKDAKRLLFAPEGGVAAGADVLVASDAAATGLNLQRGQWEIQYDTPDTAMVHGQRQGRIFRTGQKNDVELLDLVGDDPSERRARDRLRTKYGLRELMTSPMEGLDDTGLAHFLTQRGVMDAAMGVAS